MKRLDRSDEGVFERFCPEVIEKDVGDIHLTDLNHTHGDDANENESGFVRIEFQKARQKPHGKETDDGPEQDLEDGEDIPLRNKPILKNESPYLDQSSLQILSPLRIQKKPSYFALAGC